MILIGLEKRNIPVKMKYQVYLNSFLIHSFLKSGKLVGFLIWKVLKAFF